MRGRRQEKEEEEDGREHRERRRHDLFLIKSGVFLFVFLFVSFFVRFQLMVMFVCLLDFQSDIFSVVYIEAVLCFFCYGFICLYGLFYLVVQFVACPLFRSIQ